jgi:superfamily II DNA helicase RecQ
MINDNVDLQSEAKRIVTEELEKMGMISKMKAQLKSQVVKILEKQKKTIRQNIEFDYMTNLQKTTNKSKELMTAYFLIKEFMQFYEFEYTLPIFENESNIHESVRRETLINDFGLGRNKDSLESKPVLVQIITNYLHDMHQRKENNLQDSNVRSHIDVQKSEDEIKSEPLNSLQTGAAGKKTLTPLNFTNKSLDLKNEPSPKSLSESMKFNTANLGDLYSKKSDTSPEIKLKSSGISFNDPSHSNKYDDEFNEVVLEDLESSTGFKKNPNDSLEDSKKSLTGSNMVSVSMGYDNSVTNYKLDEFDYVEDINPISR